MIFFIIGHRGVGKTSLLKRIKKYSPSSFTCDLDEFIEETKNQNISDFFLRQGQKEFRYIEEQCFSVVYKKYSQESFKNSKVYIALGAGFNFSLPKDGFVIWLRRPTDRHGRVFLDRPRICKNLDPLDEFTFLYKKRNKRYEQMFHQSLFLQEGFNFLNDFEKFIFCENIENYLQPESLKKTQFTESFDKFGVITIRSNLFKSEAFLKKWIEKKISSNIKLFELRDDLLNKEQFLFLKRIIPLDRILVSLRGGWIDKDEDKNLFKGAIFDWDTNLGASFTKTDSVSLHQRKDKESLGVLFKKLVPYQKENHLKLAIPIYSWKELKEGHNWWLEDPQKRSFLPMSEDGKWSWYRLLHKNKMLFNFLREDEYGLKDQPLFCDWFLFLNQSKQFAAILGDPVDYSLTPSFHFDFFLNYKIAILRIGVNKKEFHEALYFLQKLGLVAAAVTSPLKKEAQKIIKSSLPVNTLCWSNKNWIGTNTDKDGLKKLFQKEITAKHVVVWGGGGTLEIIKKVFPQAHFYSARTGEPREESSAFFGDNPDLLIWASGNQKTSLVKGWKPKTIMDLSYTEGSLGKECAKKLGAKYINGIEMFVGQAQAQQEFWLKHLF